MSPVWGDRAEELVCTYPSLSFLWLCGGSGCQCRQEHSVTGQGMAFRDGLRWESGRTEKPPALAVGSCHIVQPRNTQEPVEYNTNRQNPVIYYDEEASHYISYQQPEKTRRSPSGTGSHW